MLSTAIVIFREAFEIALILGVVLAATRGLAGRHLFVWGGFAAGALGASAIAFFMDAISEGMEGLGQEMMNAGILFTAAFFIGWTVIWMRTHAREMVAKIKSVGAAVQENRMPYIALSLVIGLAVLREGAEIALFTYSMVATGKAVGDIVLGSVLGGAAGFALGAALYFGLIRIPTQHLFTVTSGLLTLVVCGLMAVGAGYLVSAGYFFDYSDTVWDSSAILAEGSLLGQTLHVLVGYMEQPMEIQLIFYVASFVTLIGLMWLLERPKKPSLSPAATAAIAFIAAFSIAPEAHATKRVYEPYVEKGEMEFEVLGSHLVDDDSNINGAEKFKAAIGYGVTDRWFTEIYGEMERSGVSGANNEFTAIEWENRFQLTEQGEYWMDVGAYLAYEQSFEDDHANKIEAKLLLAKDVYDFTYLANLIVEQAVGDHSEGEDPETGLALGGRYRYSPYFEPGLEWYSDFGALESIHAKNQFGPAAYGQIGDLPMKYNLGYLFGMSEAAPDGEIKAIFEYEWRF